MGRFSSLPLLILVGCLLSCSDADQITWVVPGNPSALVLQNVATVRDAAQRFADANEGRMSLDAEADTTAAGQTLIDFLPGGERLLNPYTGERTEPRNRLAEAPGEVGYVPDAIWGIASMYVINAYDESGEITRIDNIAELEANTIENARLVAHYAELWVGNWGGYATYPVHVGGLTQNFPDQRFFQNPFTLADTEPVDGAAATPGQVGYISVQNNCGYNIGFVINAFGRSSQIFETTELYGDLQSRKFRSCCNQVVWAARRFAAANDGEYPLDVKTDMSAEGKHLLDYLTCGPLVNPWTGLQMEPIDGWATNPGETGYMPRIENGVAVDFAVSGYGVSGQYLSLPLN